MALLLVVKQVLKGNQRLKWAGDSVHQNWVVNNSTHVVIALLEGEGGFLWSWVVISLIFTWKAEETNPVFRLIGFKSKLLTSSLTSPCCVTRRILYKWLPRVVISGPPWLSQCHCWRPAFSLPLFPLTLPSPCFPALRPQDQIIFGEEGGKGQLILPSWDPLPAPLSPWLCNSHYHLRDKDCLPSPGLIRLFVCLC